MSKKTQAKALALCASCPVTEECLEHTLNIEADRRRERGLRPVGIYGVKTAEERNAMLKAASTSRKVGVATS